MRTQTFSLNAMNKNKINLIEKCLNNKTKGDTFADLMCCVDSDGDWRYNEFWSMGRRVQGVVQRS